MTPVASHISMRFLPLILAAAVLCSGCVQRRMTIRSNPPGAQVYVDNHEIGRTPVSADFIYYGKRKIRLVKDGFETLTIDQSVWPKWYQIPGIDFFSENVVPWEIRDERQFDYQMQPLLVVPSETLLSRAEELRRGNQVIPASAPVMMAPAGVGLPGQYAPGPYSPPPSGVLPPTTAPTLPPSATMNYPPPGTPAATPEYSLPGDFGGRPVPQLP
jgi:hypothetical protein